MERPSENISRRSFIARAAAGFACAVGLTQLRVLSSVPEAEAASGNSASFSSRKGRFRRFRERLISRVLSRTFPRHRGNGEEISPFFAGYTKGLPHNGLGEVDKSAYLKLLMAVRSEKISDWENIPLGGPKKFKNPLAGIAFDTEGFDSSQFSVPPPHLMTGAAAASEAGELYWMALSRDVPFSMYGNEPVTSKAISDLSSNFDLSPLGFSNNQASPSELFRGESTGCRSGPHISQFLLLDVPLGTLTISQKQQTVTSGTDRMTSYELWLAAQNGFAPGTDTLDPVKRHIRNGRDLARHVHIDRVHQAFTNAALILQFGLVPEPDIQFGANAPFDPGLPYHGNSRTMTGFATWDYPHLLALVAEVTTRALKAAWFQKWFVHRRMRPEEMGGRIHNQLTGRAAYGIHTSVLESEALRETFLRYGTYLLPQVYSEGCPPHPAYPSGHAAYAGAAITVLKAWFDESYVIPSPVIPDADGENLEPYSGDDAGQMTIGGELDKLAWNIGLGRCQAGIHWRSDIREGLLLGEKVAVQILREHALSCREKISLSLRSFEKRTIIIKH